jgi:hypothetical protein
MNILTQYHSTSSGRGRKLISNALSPLWAKFPSPGFVKEEFDNMMLSEYTYCSTYSSPRDKMPTKYVVSYLITQDTS